jgi:hypothetical protein
MTKTCERYFSGDFGASWMASIRALIEDQPRLEDFELPATAER